MRRRDEIGVSCLPPQLQTISLRECDPDEREAIRC